MKTTLNAAWRAVAVLCIASIAAASHAIVLIGNYPPSNDATQSATLNDLRIKAMRFTMPAESYDLVNIILRLENATPGVPQVTIREGASTAAPGSILLTLGSAGGGAGIHDVEFTAAGSFTFQANESYYLVVGGVAGAGFNWKASSPGITPSGLATHSGSLFTTNAGGAWTNSGIMNTYEINVIPEPATLTILGVATLALMRRRKRA